MTGVAAQWCGTAPPAYRRELEQRWKKEERDAPEWGARRVILGDLSPAATFIAANYNIPFDVDAFAAAAQKLLDDVEDDIGWMYETLHIGGRTKGRINYTVWSEVFSCPECAGEVVFLAEALDRTTRRTRPTFPCPHRTATLTKDNLVRSFETFADPASSQPWRRIRLRAVLINYSVGEARYEKTPDHTDRAVLDRVGNLPLPSEVPTNSFPIDEMYHGSRLAPKGITHVHHLFLPRGAHAVAAMWRHASRVIGRTETRSRQMLLFLVDQGIATMSLLNRFRANQTSQSNQVLTGVYYIPSQVAEISPWYRFDRKVLQLPRTFQTPWARLNGAAVTTADCAAFDLPDASVDYIFTDPPFGENIPYADLNFVVESWHRVFTDTQQEATINRKKSKGLVDYRQMMQHCFEEYRRILRTLTKINLSSLAVCGLFGFYAAQRGTGGHDCRQVRGGVAGIG